MPNRIKGYHSGFDKVEKHQRTCAWTRQVYCQWSLLAGRDLLFAVGAYLSFHHGFVVIEPTNLGARILVVQSICLTIYLSPTQNSVWIPAFELIVIKLVRDRALRVWSTSLGWQRRPSAHHQRQIHGCGRSQQTAWCDRIPVCPLRFIHAEPWFTFRGTEGSCERIFPPKKTLIFLVGSLTSSLRLAFGAGGLCCKAEFEKALAVSGW